MTPGAGLEPAWSPRDGAAAPHRPHIAASRACGWGFTLRRGVCVRAGLLGVDLEALASEPFEQDGFAGGSGCQEAVTSGDPVCV